MSFLKRFLSLLSVFEAIFQVIPLMTSYNCSGTPVNSWEEN